MRRDVVAVELQRPLGDLGVGARRPLLGLLAQVALHQPGDQIAALPQAKVVSLNIQPEHKAVLEGEPLALTAYEYRILEYLMRHHQQVVAKDRLMEQLYPDDEERDPNVIEVLVGRLRRKLEGANGFKPIDTVRGMGYLFTERCR